VISHNSEGRTCPKHGEPMRLWRNGKGQPPRLRCRACHAENQRLHRAQRKAQNTKKRLSRILRGRLRAEALLDEVRWITGPAGLREAILKQMRPADRARLALLCIEAAQHETRMADEAEARHREAQVSLQDRRLQAELERMALEHLRRPGPGSIKRLGDVITARIADLRRAGWRIEPPGEA